ncbi:MAG: response regulator [Candidatus Omnitrophica bacterium]|nr:response regulator [Candidatus Omnitrophota bacterium]MDD5436008.1 response regulator [Candidatus Omnitrophota bacterium]
MASKGKILVVDDVKENVMLLEALLASADFEVLKAYGGKEAVETVKKEKPDLVLLDIMMPDIDGIQVCGILRKDPGTASIPVIMVTSKDKDSDIVRSLETGADDYIVKPVVKKELFAKVDDMLSKAKMGELPGQLYLKKMKADEKNKSDK